MQVRTHLAEELPSPLASHLHGQSLLGSVPFASLWNELGGKALYWVLYERDHPVALLPSVRFGRGPWARLQAMPDGLYVRIILLESGIDIRVAAGFVLEAIRSTGFAKVFVNDYHAQFTEATGFQPQTCSTNVVRIGGETWEPPDKKLQSEIRKAQREQAPIETFDPDRHFDAFVDLMRRTERRHGRRPKYPPSFYEALARLARTEPRICWQVCAQAGRLAASHIYLLEGEMLLSWQVFFDKAFSPLKPNQLITYSTARDMASRGAAILNLGSSPDSSESLSYYKEKWGGAEYSYTCWLRRSWLGRLL
jgi:hypothetical protein